MSDLLVHAVEHRGRLVAGYMSVESRLRLDWLIRRFNVESVIEVGSYLGLSACFFAERVETVTCVDFFDLGRASTMNPVGIHETDNQYRTFLENTLAYPNIRSIKLASLEAAQLPVVADMVYIDAGHTTAEVVADVEAWLPHAGKVICGDDNGDSRFGVSEALDVLGIPDSKERVWWKAI